MLYSIFWVTPRSVNFICRHFGTLCFKFVGGVCRKNNRNEIARVFIQVKVQVKNTLSHSKGGGEGMSKQRRRLWRATTPQVEVCSKCEGETAPCQCEEGEPQDGSDQTYVAVGCLLSLIMCRRGFQDLLKVSPSSLFMLCGCISSSTASLMRWSIYPVFVE